MPEWCFSFFATARADLYPPHKIFAVLYPQIFAASPHPHNCFSHLQNLCRPKNFFAIILKIFAASPKRILPHPKIFANPKKIYCSKKFIAAPISLLPQFFLAASPKNVCCPYHFFLPFSTTTNNQHSGIVTLLHFHQKVQQIHKNRLKYSGVASL